MPQTAFMGRASVETRASGSTEEFFERLADATESLLLLDYDGTLAPFQLERDRAYPYPGVVPLLEEMLRRGRSRIVIISGRSIAELRPLLSPPLTIEIWGSHGMEHLSADGSYRQATIPAEIAASLSNAESWAVAAGLGDRVEVKPGGVAFHWRGLPAVETERMQACAREALASYAMEPGLVLLEFDGGLELRLAHPDKGDAIRRILHGSAANIPVAYLGDDITDEAAFLALNSRGLSVLVRPEYRETIAQVWLRPPDELIAFLQRWLD
jgi:trehalose-phosphatase